MGPLAARLPPIAVLALFGLLGQLLGAGLGPLGAGIALILHLLLRCGSAGPELAPGLPVERARAAGLCLFASAVVIGLPESKTASEALPQHVCLLRFQAKVLAEGRGAVHGRTRIPVRIRGRRCTLVVAGRFRTRPPLTGDRLRGLGWLRARRPVANAEGTRRIDTQASLLWLEPTAAPWDRLRASVSTFVLRSLEHGLGPREAGLAARLTLGRKTDNLSKELREHRRLGLAHLLSISGLHTVFLAGILLAILRLVMGQRSPLVPLHVLLLFYAYLTGLRPPVVRAVIGFLVWAHARDRGTAFSVSSSLSAGIFVTLILFPEDFGSRAFCLSYLAVLGLSAFLPPLLSLWHSRWRLMQAFWEGIAASIAAQLATAAASLFYFGFLAPFGILLTPLLLPLLLAILAASVTLPAIEFVHGDLAAGLYPFLDRLIGAYLLVLDRVDALDLPLLRASSVAPPFLILCTLVVGAGLSFLTASRRMLCATFVLACLPQVLAPAPRIAERLAVLPVGHGLSTCHATRRQVLVFDCGDMLGGSLARRAIERELRLLGCWRIDHLVLSHFDMDHGNALPELLLQYEVGRIYLPETPESSRWLAQARRRRVECQVLTPGTVLRIGEGRVLLYPLETGDLAESNNASLALWIGGGARPPVLLCSDQGAAAGRALRRLCRDAGLARERFLLLPHHGDLEAARPLLLGSGPELTLLASCSSREALERIDASSSLDQAAPRCTGIDGSLLLEGSGGSGYSFRSERGRYFPAPFFAGPAASLRPSSAAAFSSASFKR